MNATPVSTSATTSTATSAPAVWRPAILLATVSLLGFGLLYSLAGAGLGGVLFPHQAGGSLIERDGRVIGSSLVAQPFAGDSYVQPRPSAASFNLMSLAGSNQARTNPDLRARVEEARTAVAAREGVPVEAVPSDLVTQSGGGIDPHLSPEAVRIQIARVARTRGLETREVERLVAAHTERPQFGLFGEPRVNVLALNLALDARAR